MRLAQIKVPVPVAVAVVFGAMIGFACGADSLVAPAAVKGANANIEQCRSFEQIMPNFAAAIDAGQTASLKHVVETQLLKEPREGGPPPINDVLRSLFVTINRLATKPAEVGALERQYCAPKNAAPPLTQANELCEIRRSLDLLVHQGKGLDALDVVYPFLQAILDYMVGRGSDGKPHYELASVLGNLCSQDANCQLSNGLDLLQAFSAYLQLGEGKKLVADLYALAEKPSFQELLAPTSALTEEGFVALLQVLRRVVASADPKGLEDAINSLPISQQAKVDLKPVIDDLKLLLATPGVITPVRRAVTCVGAKDTNEDISRMLYRLAIRDQRALLGVTKLVAALKNLEAVDERGSLIYLVGVLAGAVRSDEQAIESAASVCRTLLSTAPAPGAARSNAELILPTFADQTTLFPELICAVDTLLFGCTGGSQPACEIACRTDGGVCSP